MSNNFFTNNVSMLNPMVDIALDKISGYSMVNKVGVNTDIDTATVPEDVTDVGGVYTGFPDNELETVSVSSSSALDTSAGTGLRTIRITGLDASYNIINETITLNGTTPVNSINQFRRIHTAQGLTAGSLGVNQGTITCTHSTTTTNVFFAMRPGVNQTNVSAYTIPQGFTGLMLHAHASIFDSTGALATGYIWTRSFQGVWRARRPFTVQPGSRMDDIITGGIVFTEKSDIIMRCNFSATNNMTMFAGYDLMLIRNMA